MHISEKELETMDPYSLFIFIQHLKDYLSKVESVTSETSIAVKMQKKELNKAEAALVRFGVDVKNPEEIDKWLNTHQQNLKNKENDEMFQLQFARYRAQCLPLTFFLEESTNVEHSEEETTNDLVEKAVQFKKVKAE